MKRRFFRGDARYANPDIYEVLQAEGYKFTIPAARQFCPLGWHRVVLETPGRSPPARGRRYYASFNYQADSWNKARRNLAKL
jgi:hypothetical protein